MRCAGENKDMIVRKVTRGRHERQCSLERLEGWWHDRHFVKREVGFCARWSLDNLCERLIYPSNFVYRDELFLAYNYKADLQRKYRVSSIEYNSGRQYNTIRYDTIYFRTRYMNTVASCGFISLKWIVI